MTATIIFALTACAVVYVAWKLWARFLAAQGTIKERLWAAVRESATVAVSYLGMIAMAIPEALSAMADLLGDPALKDQVATVFPPQYAPLVGLAFLVAAYIARQRTL